MLRYDVIVIGGGPAGYTAALYTARAGLHTVVLEKLFAGGQMTQTQQIDNYPGFPKGIDGIALGMQMEEGARRFGVDTVNAEVNSAFLDRPVKTVMTSAGIYEAPVVIIATGADHKHLGIQRESELTGRGVAYCAACDGMFYRGKTVAVVGGGNSAAADAAVLSRVAEKVYLIHRRDKLRADRVYHKPLSELENLEFVFDSEVTDLLGQEQLEAIRVLDEAEVLENLPDKLRETAALRMTHPELTLSELALEFQPPVTKSCLNHRLRKIQTLAKQLQQETEEKREREEENGAL